MELLVSACTTNFSHIISYLACFKFQYQITNTLLSMEEPLFLRYQRWDEVSCLITLVDIKNIYDIVVWRIKYNYVIGGNNLTCEYNLAAYIIE